MKAVILFTRYPEPRKTKTRLIPHLGAEKAAELQRCLTEDTLSHLRDVSGPFLKPLVFFTGDNMDKVRNWLGKDLLFYPQGKGDLGEKMRSAFDLVFSEKYVEAIIIGSDVPGLTAGIIEQSFNSLKENGTVIGPCMDGGYYLLGFRRELYLPGVFSGIEWSTPDVFSSTVRFLEQNRQKPQILEKLYDLDTVNEYRQFVRERDRFREDYPLTVAFVEHNDISRHPLRGHAKM